MKTPADGWDREEREALEPMKAELAAARARHAADPPLELLRAAHADALPPDLQARVSAHLAESDWSRALVDGASDVDHVLSAADADRLLTRIKRSAEPRRSWSFSNVRLWAPLAAAAATVAIVAGVWSQWRTTVPGAPVIAPAAPQTVIARNEPARFELPLDKPDVKVSVAALTWRGPSGAASLVDDLAPALDAYRQSDYTRAAQGLEGVGRRYPSSIEAPFYRGVSLLFLNDPAGAIVELKKAERMKDAAFAPDVTWYLAVAEQRSGDTAAARAHLDALCRGTSARTPAACDAMKRLGPAR
jgi:TolA-binding protein